MMEKALWRLKGDKTDVEVRKSFADSDPDGTSSLLWGSFCENFVEFWLWNCRNYGLVAGDKVQKYPSEEGQAFLLQLYSIHWH